MLLHVWKYVASPLEFVASFLDYIALSLDYVASFLDYVASSLDYVALSLEYVASPLEICCFISGNMCASYLSPFAHGLPPQILVALLFADVVKRQGCEKQQALADLLPKRLNVEYL